MDRVAFFAHFDAQNEVKPYIEKLLRDLHGVCSRIVFVSTSELDEAELDKLRPWVEKTFCKDNVGLDFGMWQYALERTDLAGCDELVLVNSSVVGPIFPLEPIMTTMSQDPCDFWGMTENLEYHWHLQSYFLVFKRRIIESPGFRAFWKGVVPYRDKTQVVLSYELGLSQYLSDQGLKGRAFAPMSSWASALERWWMRCTGRYNPTLFYPMKLLQAGVPLVKIRFLKDNKGKGSAKAVLGEMRAAGYDPALVRFLTD